MRHLERILLPQIPYSCHVLQLPVLLFLLIVYKVSSSGTYHYNKFSRLQNCTLQVSGLDESSLKGLACLTNLRYSSTFSLPFCFAASLALLPSPSPPDLVVSLSLVSPSLFFCLSRHSFRFCPIYPRDLTNTIITLRRTLVVTGVSAITNGMDFLNHLKKLESLKLDMLNADLSGVDFGRLSNLTVRIF